MFSLLRALEDGGEPSGARRAGVRLPVHSRTSTAVAWLPSSVASPGTELPERAVALRNCHPPFCAQVRLDLRGSEGPSKILRMAQNWTFGASLHRPPQSKETSAIAWQAFGDTSPV